MSSQSQETEIWSGNTGRLNRNLYVVLKFTERSKTLGITSKTGDFCANLDEKNADMFNFQRDGTGNGFSNIKDTSVESVQLQMSVLHQSLCIFKAGLFQVHLMTGQNIRKKYLMCQIPVKTLKQHAIPNSSLHNLKIYSLKSCRKISQR